MSGENHEKKSISGKMMLGIGLIVVGIFIGAYAADALSPWIAPEKALLVSNTETIQQQNKLLKEQVDCLVGGIEASHGKATIDECT
jgi:predicted transcriptional regulator